MSDILYTEYFNGRRGGPTANTASAVYRQVPADSQSRASEGSKRYHSPTYEIYQQLSVEHVNVTGRYNRVVTLHVVLFQSLNVVHCSQT